MKKLLIALFLLIAVNTFAGQDFEIDTQNAFSNGNFYNNSTFTGTLGANEAEMDATCSLYTEGAQWSCAAGVSTKAGAGTSTLSVTTTPIEAGKLYKWTASITTGTAGTGLTPSAGGNTMAALTVTDATWVTYFYATATTTPTFTPGSAWEGSVTTTGLYEVSSDITATDVAFTSTNTKQPLLFKGTLDSATGNETAYVFAYQQNKAAGNSTGLLIAEDSPGATAGTKLGIDYQVDGTSVFAVTSAGQIKTNQIANISGITMLNLSTSTLTSAGNDITLTFQTRNFTTADNATEMSTGTFTNSSGIGNAVVVKPVLNSTGTAAHGGILYAPTLTAVGSGTQDGIVSSLGSLAAADGVNHTWSAFKADGNVAFLDGTDVWNGLNIAITSGAPNHTGGTINAINIGSITADTQATESAINIGTGWDYSMYSAGGIGILGSPITLFNSHATTGLRLLQTADMTGTPAYSFTQNAATTELIGTGSQTFMQISPEIDVSTRTGAATIDHLLLGDAADGGYTGTPAAQALTLNGLRIASTLPALTSDDTYSGIVIAPTNANHSGGLVRGIGFGNITGDAEAIEAMIDLTATGWDGVFKITTDDVDPTGGGGAATGRIQVRDTEGNLHYIPYY